MSGSKNAKRRSVIALLILSMVFTIGSFTSASPASATSTSEEKMWRYINNTRVNYGRAKLRLSQPLSDKARAHSRRMREKGTIFHTKSLTYTLRNYSWTVAGENVGMGPSMYKLHKAFMASPGHKSNIIYRGYRRVGIGVAWKNGTAFITVMFMNYG